MNEHTNTTKWLQYLYYVALVSLIVTVLGIIGLSGLTRWIGLAINAATIYLLLQLTGANPRYKTSAIFYVVALAAGFINSALLGLVGSICGLVAQYQEYHAHGELIEEKDPKLADKWNSLFGLELALTFVGILLMGLLAGLLVAVTNMSEATVVPIITIIVAVLGVSAVPELPEAHHRSAGKRNPGGINEFSNHPADSGGPGAGCPGGLHLGQRGQRRLHLRSDHHGGGAPLQAFPD